MRFADELRSLVGNERGFIHKKLLGIGKGLVGKFAGTALGFVPGGGLIKRGLGIARGLIRTTRRPTVPRTLTARRTPFSDAEKQRGRQIKFASDAAVPTATGTWINRATGQQVRGVPTGAKPRAGLDIDWSFTPDSTPMPRSIAPRLTPPPMAITRGRRPLPPGFTPPPMAITRRRALPPAPIATRTLMPIHKTFAPDCVFPRRLDPRTNRCRLFVGEESGPNGGAPVGEAVMGQYGAALQPGVMTINRAVCLPGMQLGDDGLCYNKAQISNKQRMWPAGRKPLLTGGDMRAISIAARAGRRLEGATKRLQRMGMMKKPARGRLAPGRSRALVVKEAGPGGVTVQ